MSRIVAWGRRPFQFTLLAAIQFVIVTGLAMLVYPGGTAADPATQRYSFFDNFFSDLGLTVAHNGQANTLSLILFVISLSLAGLGLVAFFLAAPRFFRQPRLAFALSLAGSVVGIVSGLAYVGIALTPADLVLAVHREFVQLAFQAFLGVVVLYSAAIGLGREIPRRYALVFVAFALLLAAYLWLMASGPRPGTPEGLRIQATGQKVIVYAAILCMAVQSIGVLRLLRSRR